MRRTPIDVSGDAGVCYATGIELGNGDGRFYQGDQFPDDYWAVQWLWTPFDPFTAYQDWEGGL